MHNTLHTPLNTPINRVFTDSQIDMYGFMLDYSKPMFYPAAADCVNPQKTIRTLLLSVKICFYMGLHVLISGIKFNLKWHDLSSDIFWKTNVYVHVMKGKSTTSMSSIDSNHSFIYSPLSQEQFPQRAVHNKTLRPSIKLRKTVRKREGAGHNLIHSWHSELHLLL